tara:strand:+ start:260 stop:427 length:168 start_codon:yes stop_codon:yes gene_type:complete
MNIKDVINNIGEYHYLIVINKKIALSSCGNNYKKIKKECSNIYNKIKNKKNIIIY